MTALVGCVAGCWGDGEEVARPRIVFVPEAPAVEVVGLDRGTLAELRALPATDPEWARVFPVSTAEARREGGPAILGDYAVVGERVRFRPRFPWVAGVTYVARWRPAGAVKVEAAFTPEGPRGRPSTVVTAVYPSGEEVPENLLRLYLHFSAPMSRGQAALHVRLLTDEGEEVEEPFVAPDQELWSPPRDRLTLLLDPGRIKRGVGPHLEVGSPLRAGRGYRLVIDAGWRDARGLPLVRGFEKRFRAVAADRSSPVPREWRLRAPATPGEPLRVEFPAPLDHGLLLGKLTVHDATGRAVAGVPRVGPGELAWEFRPEASWVAGAYQLRVDPALEDPSGNSVRRPFETAIGGGEPPPPRAGEVRLPFRVGAARR